VIGSNVFNLAALLGLGAVVAGKIRLHRRVILLEGAVALLIATICLGVVLGGPGPGAGLLAAVVVLVPYLVISGVSTQRLSDLGMPRAWARWLSQAVIEEQQELEPAIHPPPANGRDVTLAVFATAVVVGASVAMELSASTLGTRHHVAQIVIGGLVLAGVTSLPNVVSALYLAVRGRGAATPSTALNSNALNVTLGLLLPGILVGLGPPSGQGTLIAAWYVALTAITLACAYTGRGLRRQTDASEGPTTSPRRRLRIASADQGYDRAGRSLAPGSILSVRLVLQSSSRSPLRGLGYRRMMRLMSGRDGGRWARLGRLVPSLIGVYELRYVLGRLASAGPALLGTDRLYAHPVKLWVLALLALGSGAMLLEIGRGVHRQIVRPRWSVSLVGRWLLCFSVLLGVLCCPDLMRSLSSSGHPAGLVTASSAGMWCSVAAALSLGLLVAASLGGARWILSRIARLRRRWSAPRRRGVAVVRVSVGVQGPAPVPLLAGWSGRGPPAGLELAAV
jgi:hypothetical protein